MKKFLLILLIIISSCQNKENDIIGTWSLCVNSGEYVEWKIQQNKIFILGVFEDKIAIFKSEIDNNERFKCFLT